MPRAAGVRPALAPLVLLAGLAACGDRRALIPQFPQIDQARELGESGVERLRDSNACRAETDSVEALIRCMERRGWTYVRRWGPYPSDVCWDQREANDTRRLPDPMCFERGVPAPTPAPAVTPPGEPGR
jgi:hypothetical protein